MDDDSNYGPSPAARVIEEQRLRIGASVREAARRSDLSEGRWRQIAKGYQQVTKGVKAPVNAPAVTLARMAHTVGVNDEELEAVGATDVVEELARLYRRPGAMSAALLEHLDSIGDVPLTQASDEELVTEMLRRLKRTPTPQTEGPESHVPAAKTRAGASPAEDDYAVATRSVETDLEPGESASPPPAAARPRPGQP